MPYFCTKTGYSSSCIVAFGSTVVFIVRQTKKKMESNYQRFESKEFADRYPLKISHNCTIDNAIDVIGFDRLG